MDAIETVIITDPANVNENAICEGPNFVVVPRFLPLLAVTVDDDDDGWSKQKTIAAPIQVDKPAIRDKSNGVLQSTDVFTDKSS